MQLRIDQTPKNLNIIQVMFAISINSYLFISIDSRKYVQWFICIKYANKPTVGY